jgi:hypothetical protein
MCIHRLLDQDALYAKRTGCAVPEHTNRWYVRLMDDIGDLTKRLADVQKELWDLPDDAFAERFELKEKQAALRAEAAQYAGRMDEGLPSDDLLVELAALRSQMVAIEKQRIDLVTQAGSSSAGEMGNLGGYGINKGIEDAMGLPKIKARIGRIKGILIDRNVPIPDE